MRVLVAAALFASLTASQAQTDRDRREWPRTDFAKRTVELSEIESGGPPKDGIPAIDRPSFVKTNEALEWLNPKEPVIALRFGREVRAYPLQILMFHEIVNDTVEGVPLAVTFCPLCNASIVFERRVGGRVLDFGTTGKLRLSDLVMYDRQTESWWQQFTGKGIVGRYAGAELKRVGSEIVAFEDFAAAHPGGMVLSRQTGFERPYGSNPYAGYDRADQIPFLLSVKPDERLPPMERVLSVKDHLYPLSLLEQHAVLNRSRGGLSYVIFVKQGMRSPLDREVIAHGRPIPAATAFERRIGGMVLTFEALSDGYVDRETGSQWNILGEAVSGPLKGKRLPGIGSGVHFAFAWLAFNPQSEVVRELP